MHEWFQSRKTARLSAVDGPGVFLQAWLGTHAGEGRFATNRFHATDRHSH